MSQALRKAELYASLQPAAWYALCVDRERRALGDLVNRGIEAWLPECRIVVTRRRRRETIDGPLFPGYLFVRGVLTDDWLAAVLEPDDVDDILRMHGRPVAAREQQMTKLRQLLDQHDGRIIIEAGRIKRGFNHPIDEPTFTPGQEVRVLDGPFTSFNAIFKEQSGIARIKIMLDIFGRATEMEIDEASVEAVA